MLQEEEKQHMSELFDKQKFAEVEYCKFNDARRLFSDFGSIASIGGTVISSIIGMSMIFICSFIDGTFAGQVGIVFSYITLILALSIPIVFFIHRYLEKNADKWDSEKHNINKQIKFFQQSIDTKPEN